jgi:hypothetical protein
VARDGLGSKARVKAVDAVSEVARLSTGRLVLSERLCVAADAPKRIQRRDEFVILGPRDVEAAGLWRIERVGPVPADMVEVVELRVGRALDT